MERRADSETRLGPTARSLARWRTCSWPAALLAASVLSSGFLLTQAQDIEVTVEPTQTLEQGQDAILTPGGKGFVACNWYRGVQAEANRIFKFISNYIEAQQNGPAFTGRETAGPRCSLHIRSVALSDNGNYTVTKTPKGGDPETGRVQLQVLGSPSSFEVAAGTIWGIVVGSLAVAGLAGTLLFCSLRARRRKEKSSKQMDPTSPVYENTAPSAQVMPENSSYVDHTYEELQPGRRSVYDQLKW